MRDKLLRKSMQKHLKNKGFTIQSTISDSAHYGSKELVDAVSNSEELVDAVSDYEELFDAVSDPKSDPSSDPKVATYTTNDNGVT